MQRRAHGSASAGRRALLLTCGRPSLEQEQQYVIMTACEQAARPSSSHQHPQGVIGRVLASDATTTLKAILRAGPCPKHSCPHFQTGFETRLGESETGAHARDLRLPVLLFI